MDIKQTIERKRAEIAQLEAEIEALEKAHKIMVDEFAKEVVLNRPNSNIQEGTISWGTVQDKTAIRPSVQIEMPVEKDEDTEIKDALRKFSQL